ncbi:MAG: hypothetical protein KKD44_27945 [Proteobacteria bacterium]|nr:hypothetical protein [Pseudomonadota bacterium]
MAGCDGGCSSSDICRFEVSEEEMKNLTGLSAKDILGDFLGFHVVVKDGRVQIAARFDKGVYSDYECNLLELARAVRKL